MEVSLIDCLDYRMIASHIEAIGDHACKIARDIIEFSNVSIPEDISHYILDVSNITHNMHETAMQAVFSKTYGPIDAVAENRLKAQTIIDKVKTLLVEQNPEVSSFVSSVNFSLNRICDASVDIADIVLPR
jgi:phosphate uptake regulator